MRILWPGKTYREWGALLQTKLHRKQKVNPNELALGELRTLIEEEWDKYVLDDRFFFENEKGDYLKLRDVSVIRNSKGAHWIEKMTDIDFKDIERDSVWALTCTLYLFNKLYLREFLIQPNRLKRKYSVFICHASEDKDEVARPLAESLKEKNLTVWYDEYTLVLGDSLFDALNKGIVNTDFGIVILSPAFFEKKWPKRELNGLITHARAIFPIWHNVDREHVRRYLPILADRIAVSTDQGLDKVVEEILKAISKIRERD